MNLYALPWLELSVLIPLAGAVWVGRIRDPNAASRFCLAFTGAALVCAIMVAAGYWTGAIPSATFGAPWLTKGEPWDLGPRIFGRPVLGVDELSALLIPLLALLHFLVALATARTKMARFSFAWLLIGESIRLASFSCLDPWVMIGLLAVVTIPPYFELVRRGRPTRVYVLHMVLFVGLLMFGWSAVDGNIPVPKHLAAFSLFAAILIRSGTIPFHVWVTDLFECGAFGSALLYVSPVAGVYTAVRLVLPVAPDWVLQWLGLVSLVTAVYTAGMALVQRDARRFFAYLFLSHASLILVGLELAGAENKDAQVIGLTGGLALWVAVALSLSGLGLTLRALEARLGRLSLTEYKGLYEQSPALAVCFLLTGLASVGFPGTLGFVASELLVDGAIGANQFAGVVVVLTATINGIGVVRAYMLLFTGGRYATTVSLGITRRERFAVLTLAALIIGGGLIPQPLVMSRHAAAEAILADRAARATLR
jgi:NADH-quinone oxidoreductase subunit M